MATHSSVLAWRIPGMAEPGGLPSMGSHRVGHNWSDLAAAAATSRICVHFFLPSWPLSKVIILFPFNFYSRLLSGLPASILALCRKVLHINSWRDSTKIHSQCIANPLDHYLVEIPAYMYAMLFIYHYPTSADFSCLISSGPPIKLCLPPILASCCCSITQPCPTLWSPMDFNMPAFPVLPYLPEFVQTHDYWVDDVIQPSHPLSPPSPLALNLSQHHGHAYLPWHRTGSSSLQPFAHVVFSA